MNGDLLSTLKQYADRKGQPLEDDLFQSIVLQSFVQVFGRLDALDKKRPFGWFIDKVLPSVVTSTIMGIVVWLLFLYKGP